MASPLSVLLGLWEQSDQWSDSITGKYSMQVSMTRNAISQ
jgi:hypothetical protein